MLVCLYTSIWPWAHYNIIYFESIHWCSTILLSSYWFCPFASVWLVAISAQQCCKLAFGAQQWCKIAIGAQHWCKLAIGAQQCCKLAIGAQNVASLLLVLNNLAIFLLVIINLTIFLLVIYLQVFVFCALASFLVVPSLGIWMTKKCVLSVLINVRSLLLVLSNIASFLLVRSYGIWIVTIMLLMSLWYVCRCSTVLQACYSCCSDQQCCKHFTGVLVLNHVASLLLVLNHVASLLWCSTMLQACCWCSTMLQACYWCSTMLQACYWCSTIYLSKHSNWHKAMLGYYVKNFAYCAPTIFYQLCGQ